MVAIVESILARLAVTLILGATLVASTLGAWFRRLFIPSDARASGQPINIAVIGTFYNDGWFQSHVKPLIACGIIGRIHIVTDQPLAQHDKVCYHCPSKTLRACFGRTIARLLVLIQLARKQRPGLLMGYHIMPNALMALVVARWFGIRAAYQMTGGPIQLIGGGVGSENRLLRRQAVSSRLREALMFAIARRFDFIIVRGESSGRFIREVAPNVHCDIIPGCIDTNKINESPADKTYNLIAVGRLVDVKRYDRMLNILAELKQLRPSFRAAIVGDGPLSARLRGQSIALGIDANVDFLGQRNDVPELLTRAQLFLLTSENEGLSIAMMEAMAAGLPAIVPPVGDLPDLVSDGKTGLLIDPRDAHHTAERIAALLDHSGHLDELAENARSKATAHASVSNVAARWSRCLSAMSVDSPAPMPGTARTALGIFAAALLVRLLFCFAAVPLLQLKTGPSQADFFTSTDGYMNIAKTLVDHGKYAFAADAPPTSYRAPMFPFAIASGYALLRDVGVSVLVVNCLASALTCVLVYFIAVRLVGTRAGLALLIPAIIFPLSIYYCASSFSDTYFAFAMALYLLTLLRLMQSPNRRSGLLHGIAFAFAALTKAVVLPLPLVVGAYALIRRPCAIRPLVMAILVGFAGIGIWTARNYASTGRFVLVTGGSGYNALIGNFMIDEWTDCDTALAHGRRLAQARVQEEQGSVIKTRDLRPTNFLDVPPDIDQIYGRSAMQMMLDSPLLLMRKLTINSVRFWYFSSSKAKSFANGLVNGLILLFALAALPELLRTRRPEIEIIGLIAITFVVLYSLIIVHSSRFCLPMVMVLTPMASLGFARLVRLILSERQVNSLLQRA